MLTIRMAPDPALPPAHAAQMRLACRYSAAGPALVCHDPNGALIDMRRAEMPVPGEVSALIAAIRARR